jgi:cyclopropane-fatty-acyl-phospholipid synthase
LGRLFSGLVKQGRLRIRDHDGQVYEFGEPNASLDAGIALHGRATAWRLLRNPALAIGEAYVDGDLTIEEGTLLSFLRLLLTNTQDWNDSFNGRLYFRLENILRMPAVLNPVSRARQNVKHHYDLSGELFSLFLDADRQYSCAYFRSEDDDIESAQLSKKQHIAAKLNIHPGQHVLDIGSGWGGLALYIAQHYPVRVTGLTLSDEQFNHATRRAQQLGLADRVDFKLRDYRQETGLYDRIVSVGMFEHVGRPHFATYFKQLSSLLKSNGVALVHTIGWQTPPSPINPWLRRYIFPGAYLPALSQVTPIIESRRMWLTDLENLRLHYAATLKAWSERFHANRDRILRLYDERFCRMWEFYLQSCEAGFRWGGLTVYQLQLTKAIDALPNIRDYMTEEENRLRKEDAIAQQHQRAQLAGASPVPPERRSA